MVANRTALVVVLMCVVSLCLWPSPGSLRAADEIQWKNLGPGAGGNIISTAVSPHDPNLVLTASDVGGVMRSADGGQTWKLANDGISLPHLGGMYGSGGVFAFHPTDPNLIYLGMLKSTDAGQHWTLKVVDNSIGGSIAAIDRLNPEIVYVAGYANVFKSTCGWESACSYTSSCLPSPSGGPSDPGCLNFSDSIRSLLIHPTNPMQLIACADSGLYRSVDGAVTWTHVGPGGLPPSSLPHEECNSMVLHHDESTGQTTLYMVLKTQPSPGSALGDDCTGPWQDIDSWRGGVFKSIDWGATWTEKNGTGGANVLSNPGFTTAGGDPSHPAANWVTADQPTTSLDGLVGNTTPNGCSGPCSGAPSIRVTGGPGGVTTDPYQAVEGGKLYKISAWFKADATDGLTAYIEIQYYDAQETQVPFPGPQWGVEPFYYGGESTYETWRRFEALVRPPGEARFARIALRPAHSAGTVWIDDVSLRLAQGVPKVSGQGHCPYFVSYNAVAVDPLDVNTVYIGTAGNSFLDIPRAADVGGIWKTVDGGTTWFHVTRSQYLDNVLDGVATGPLCGNGLCEGRWENCGTCSADCAGPACCGDHVCSASENHDNCLVDCPFCKNGDPALPRDACCGDGFCAGGLIENATICPVDCSQGQPPRPYYEVKPGFYGVWGIGIGAGASGHRTLHFGSSHYKTIDGGTTWEEVSSSLQAPTQTGEPEGTWKARGETSDVFAHAVVTDARVPDRLYYGDADGYLQVSYNGGQSFGSEGWQWYGMTPKVIGDSATSIVLDPTDPDRIFVGVATSPANIQPGDVGGAVIGTFDANPPDGRHWSWDHLGGTGEGMMLPAGGGVDLIRDELGSFYASVFGQGVFKLAAPAGENEPWVKKDTNWVDADGPPGNPDGWQTYPIVREPAAGWIYVGTGDPAASLPTSASTGVWESSDRGETWRKITDSSSLEGEPVVALLPVGSDTLFVGTWFAYRQESNQACTGGYTGAGGLYKGARDQNGNWTWDQVLCQPKVSGIAVSSLNSSILYAAAGQVGTVTYAGQQAGIYKSVDGGETWTILPNNGLMNLGTVKLYFSATDAHKLYAATQGDGVFEGTITCGPVSEGFVDVDNDGVPDCAFTNITEQVGMATGSIVSGTYSALSCSSTANTYEVLKEQTSGNQRKMVKVWKFDNVPTGKQYDLWVEGFKTPAGTPSDNFDFSLVSKDAGSSCSSGDAFGPTLLTVSKTSDDNQAQIANAGTISNPVVCLRVQDSIQTTDKKSETLTLDRVCLVAIP